MNLIDMLSAETPPMINESNEYEMSSILEKPNRDSVADSASTQQRVYYLPTVQSRTQIELSEMLIQIFRNAIQDHANTINPRTSIQSLLEDSSEESNTNKRNAHFDHLFDLLDRLSRHPALLVDHFMPKQLLLLTTNDKNINMCGKMRLLDRLVDLLCHDYRKNKFHLVVVAPSTKELELVEALIIGKTLHYTSLSNFKLFDHEPHVATAGLHVHLVTSQQLENNFMTFIQSKASNDPFNMIFSLDTGLNVSSASIDLIRAESDNLCTFMPISLCSIEHIKTLMPPTKLSFAFNKDASESMYKWKAKIISVFVMNRKNYFQSNVEPEDYISQNYGSRLNELMACINKQPNKIHEKMSKCDKMIDLMVLKAKVTKHLATSFIELDIPACENLAKFKTYLAQACTRRVSRIQEETRDLRENRIADERLAELKLQLEIDIDDDNIAEIFKTLTRTNQDAEANEQKLSRAEMLLVQRQEENHAAHSQYEYLKSQDFGSEITSAVLDQQTQELQKLQQKALEIEAEYDRLCAEICANRQKYQDISANGVQKASNLATLVNQNEIVLSKMNSAGAIMIPKALHNGSLATMKSILEYKIANSDFIQKFGSTHVDRVVKHRRHILDNTASVSSVRQNNRTSRAVTPHG